MSELLKFKYVPLQVGIQVKQALELCHKSSMVVQIVTEEFQKTIRAV